MKDSAQSPRDKILWILSTNGRKMKRSELRRRSGIKLHELILILEDLEKLGKIQIDSKDNISLI